jgi:DNA-binding response OmpR family regulator
MWHKGDAMHRTILIVEDSPTELALVSDCLQTAGYQVLQASSGKEARDYLEKDQVIDLIILDLILPDVNGYDLYRTFRNHPSTSQIPIVMLTQRDSMPEEYYGRMLGAEAYLKKPFRETVLLQELQRLLPLR